MPIPMIMLLFTLLAADAERPPMGDYYGGGATYWTQVFLFLTTIVGFAYQAYRENRNRKWEREDRETKAEEVHRVLVEQARRLESNLEGRADSLAKTTTEKMRAATAEVVGKVEEAKQINVQALDAANSFHAKADEMQRASIKAAVEAAAEVARCEAETVAEKAARRVLEKKLEEKNRQGQP